MYRLRPTMYLIENGSSLPRSRIVGIVLEGGRFILYALARGCFGFVERQPFLFLGWSFVDPYVENI